MFKNRFLLVLGIISLVLVSLAISSFLTNDALSKREAAWNYVERRTNADAPGGVSPAAILERQAAWDYAERRTNAASPVVIYSDSQPIPSNKSGVDLTDYYFRHIVSRSLP